MTISTKAKTMTRVEELWREIASQTARTGLFRRVDDTHPLHLYAGIDHQGKRVLLLVVRDVPPNLPPPGIVEVACNQREDAEWAIIVQLARPDFDELFGGSVRISSTPLATARLKLAAKPS